MIPHCLLGISSIMIRLNLVEFIIIMIFLGCVGSSV